jgi:hypothetical protein
MRNATEFMQESDPARPKSLEGLKWLSDLAWAMKIQDSDSHASPVAVRETPRPSLRRMGAGKK